MCDEWNGNIMFISDRGGGRQYALFSDGEFNPARAKLTVAK